MPYININEYDNTITGPKSNNGHIVAIPINAKDGPSDRWITVGTYDEFVQLFGPKIVTTSSFGTSWDYAANLLMREMPVCVRRITHEITEDGLNTITPLSGVATATGIIKIKDIIGSSSISSDSFIEELIGVVDPNKHSELIKSNPGTTYPNPLYKQYTNNVGQKEDHYPSIYDLEMDETARQVNAWADVIDNGASYPYTKTENEWIYIGETDNPHYRNTDEQKPIANTNEILAENPDGEIGDFFVVEDPNPIEPLSPYCRLDFAPGTKNENYLNVKAYYPFDLVYKDPFSITSESFIDVTYSGDLLTITDHVWKYTNCKFFTSEEHFNKAVTEQAASINPIKEGDIVLIVDKHALYNVVNKSGSLALGDIITTIVNTSDDLQSLSDDITQAFVVETKTTWHRGTSDDVWEDNEEDTNNVNNIITFVNNKYYKGTFESFDKLESGVVNPINESYAIVENDDSYAVYQYGQTTSTWVRIPATKEQVNSVLLLSPEDYNNKSVYKIGNIVGISWIDTEANLGDGIYKRTFNWKLATGDDRNRYFEKIHWEATSNPLYTTPHEEIRDAKVNINNIIINTAVDVNKTNISTNINGWGDITIDSDYKDNRLISGKVGITNNSYEPIKIYSFRIIEKADDGTLSLVYNSGIERVTSTTDSIAQDPLIQVTLINDPNNPVGTSALRPKLDLTTEAERWYFELEPGATLFYNRNLTNVQINLSVAIFDESDIVVHTFNSANGTCDICLSTYEEMEITKTALSELPVEEDINNLPIVDGKGNFNLFIAKYIYPGSNGNSINLRIRTIRNQGIYIYVYRNTQYLERIELCAFRETTSNNRVRILDLDLNKDDIWRKLLTKFGILIGINDKIATPTSLYGNYVKIDLNHNLINYDSYDYINSLYAQTGTQITYLTGGADPDDEHVIHEIPKCYKPLEDKYRYDITFITNGGYVDKLVLSSSITSPSATEEDRRLIEDAMLEVATSRKDCVAYLDAPVDVTEKDIPFYFEHISTSYAAAYDPWCLITLATGDTKWMPPSFVQLYTHAKSIANGNKMYLPPAGVRRALVPEIISINHELPSSYITDWQNLDAVQFINPILWINGFDYTIYGQKTLYNIVNQSDKYQSALQNLNVRLVANEIKKLIFRTCIDLTFELNNMMTWNEFKSKIEPTLQVMQAEGVLTTYEVLMGTETMTSADLNSGHIVGVVRVAIVSAATDWDINFEIQPNNITFYENDYNTSYSE